MSRTLSLIALAVAAPAAAGPPNVLVVLSDDHSVPHLGCYGNPDIKTPNFDAFAKTAVRFDRAYVACPQCVPSRAATAMFAEVRALAKAGKLPDPLNALYDGRPRDMIELFDLEHDPSEFRNLAGKPEAAAVEKRLRAALVEWMALERDYLPLPIAPRGGKK